MSWAAHNPEKYDAICTDAINDWIIDEYAANCEEPDDSIRVVIANVVDILYQRVTVRDELLALAHIKYDELMAERYGRS